MSINLKFFSEKMTQEEKNTYYTITIKEIEFAF